MSYILTAWENVFDHRFGNGDWTPDSRNTYNVIDPVARSTAQVYPGGWTAVYALLENPGMWNLRSQNSKNLYLGSGTLYQSMMLILTLSRSTLHQKTSYYAVSLQVSLAHCSLLHELYQVWSLSWTHFQFTGIFDPSNVPAPAPGPLTGLWLGNLIEWQLVFKF